ncbi:MAG TPA: VPLPA-CTERM sorting domain-containing protein [Steroidobacteraceae bacterium]|nr:VPLPA-CTERM sorting domain-containing protein [Steroidobacteraceae bacterium]
MRKVIAGGALLLCSAAALAAPVTPPATYTADQTSGGSGSGGLFVAVWDDSRGVSLVTYLGINMDQLLPATAEQTGFSLEFGTLSQFSSVFGASDDANIRYALFGVDTLGVGNNGKRVLGTTTATAFSLTNGNVSGTAGNLDQFILGALTAAVGNGGNGGANPAVALSTAEADSTSKISWSSLGATAFNTTVGSALNMFLASSLSNNAGAQANVDFFNSEDGQRFGQWLLSADGVLSYTAPAAVPLPAAAWLLLSGLAGLGAIGRRRANA